MCRKCEAGARALASPVPAQLLDYTCHMKLGRIVEQHEVGYILAVPPGVVVLLFEEILLRYTQVCTDIEVVFLYTYR